ncbi:MAG: DUF6054 family protein [Oscillospiraceae bacterium]|nr:DUF6054 family protein [Oscillospiraceae bacterium]
MAKYEKTLTGNFDDFLKYVEQGVLGGSISASFEDGSDYENNGIRCAVRVYERYSMIGSNRVSMNITLIGHDDNLFVSAITSGGSQAVFLKINTFGEKAFLDNLVKIIESYKANN